MTAVLDLCVTLMPPPPGAAPEALANIDLRCDALGLSHFGDLLTDPLTSQERQDLQWYLEEYWQWPYEQFRERGKRIEQLLPTIGKRLYDAIFGTMPANRILQAWRLQSAASRQLSIVSGIPAVLSLPWELLHDEQGFLVLRTRQLISLIRRLLQQELAALRASFQPPLRILLATARPEDTGFLDPRSTARELFDEMQEQIDTGAVVIEVLRPPTLQALRHRLQDITRPVHLFHFDGHGTFGPKSMHQDERHKSDGEQGKLAFEDTEHRLALVEASDLAQVLQDSGVHLAVLDACQSAMGSADDAFSSVAARLIQGGVDAVIAMSASVLVASSTRYMGAFYRELAQGTAVPIAQERARQALHDDSRRHLSRRRRDEEGTPVELRDWWLPHYYQQRPLAFSSTKPVRKSKQKRTQAPFARLSEQMPGEPRYGFRGRARELLLLERSLMQGKLIVITGYGGMGKTALAREAADWFTRTGMYQGACFVSFEGGRGSATSLLSQIGFLLGVYDGIYTPDDHKTALSQLRLVLRRRRILVIADNLESLLPGGEALFEPGVRTQLWDVLLELQRLGAGVLLTSRSTAFGDGRLAEGANVIYLSLAGLSSDDAYTLASSLLASLSIDRSRAPYDLLREMLRQLDHHPLAIQLVLPALRTRSLLQIKEDFAVLLPRFTDDTVSGRNRSLVTSLEYSTQRLSETQRTLLPRLAVFEGGAMESDLLAITEIPEAIWTELRLALEQAALLTVEHFDWADVPFLHFHPVLIPFLRGQAVANDKALLERYVQRYYEVSVYYYEQDSSYPMQTRTLVQRDLPNLRRVLMHMLEVGALEEAIVVARNISQFLAYFGLHRENALLQQHLSQALAARQGKNGDMLTQIDYIYESSQGEEEYRKGHLRAAITWFSRLLARIEAQPKAASYGPDSYEHATTLGRLGRCYEAAWDLSAAERQYRRALTIAETLLKQDPEERIFLVLQANIMADLGDVSRKQGQYAHARAAHERSLQIKEQIGDLRGQAVSQGQLGFIALEQGEYEEARQYYQQSLTTFQMLGEPAEEAGKWHQLGRVAQAQQDWSEAERCYRESLVRKEQLADLAGAARTCGQLGQVALVTNRFEEAKGWYQRALGLSEQTDVTSGEYATHLFNLANLLVREVEVGRVQETSAQLTEAQRYIEQAVAISERLRSLELWMMYQLLARVATLQGQVELVQDYRCSEREAYAAFAGHRFQIDQQFGSLLPAFATAKDNLEARAQVEEILPDLEAQGWHLTQALYRVWAGEKDWQKLSEELDDQEALVILRVLEIGAEPS